MGHFLLQPPGRAIVEEVSQIFKSGKLFIKRDHKLLFVCGGPLEGVSLRGKFMTYAKSSLKDWRIFLAESSFSDLQEDGDNQYINLAELEKFTSDIADCVLIFPESVGSYAEVGYFSAFDELSKKTLIANRVKYQASGSFLNRGPIHKINQKSQFGSSVSIVESAGEFDFDPVQQMLSNVKLKTRKRVKSDEVAELGLKERFCLAIYFLSIFPILSAVELSVLFQKVFGKSDYHEVRNIISLLYSAKYANRVPDEDKYILDNVEFEFVDVEGHSLGDLRSKILNSYQKHAPELLELVGQVQC